MSGFFKIAISAAALLVAVIGVILIAQNTAGLGNEPLIIRALGVNVSVLAALMALYPWLPLFHKRPLRFLLATVMPAMLPALIYFLILLPRQAGEGITAAQLDMDLITDRSSNGIVEVGFAYPIFTPTITVKNEELFTRRLNVFFRMTDAAGNSTLFRGVRAQIPESGLSVEATVRGMLSENEGYLFNPLVLPPLRTITSRVVFIVTSIEDGGSFTEALRQAQSARLELRHPDDETLEVEIPIAGL